MYMQNIYVDAIQYIIKCLTVTFIEYTEVMSFYLDMLYIFRANY